MHAAAEQLDLECLTPQRVEGRALPWVSHSLAKRRDASRRRWEQCTHAPSDYACARL